MDDISTPDGILTRIAEQQHGLVTRRQAAESGLGRASLRRRIERGDWTPIGHRVLRRTGSPPSVEMSALAGVLDAGPSAYLAIRAAAGLWGVPGFRVEPVEVIALRHRRLVDPVATIHLRATSRTRSPRPSVESRWYVPLWSCCSSHRSCTLIA